MYIINFMQIKENKKIDATTKKAWEENWTGIGVENILEIFDYPRVKEQINLYKPYLPKHKNILEGGCGLGPYVVYFQEKGYELIGIDYNYQPLAELNRYNNALRLACADVCKLPFPDSFFGAYLSFGVIEHFTAGPQEAIKEAYRVIESDGIFIVSVPRLSIFHKIRMLLDLLKNNKIIRKIFNKEIKEKYWQQYFSLSGLSKALKGSGFDILKIAPIDQEHSLVTFLPFFKDKRTLDGATSFALKVAKGCKRYLPWATAATMVFICKKI